VILPDANLLIYAVNRDTPLHVPARAWLERVLSGTEPVALVWMVLLAFIRITTNPRIFAKPLATDHALAYVDGWLRQPHVRPLSPGDRHWMIVEGLLRTSGSAGNLVNDAHLAAIAIEHGCTLYSADHDFQRFSGLDFVDPLKLGQVHDR
jgi:toxin-antitoxin system PIN domain toxin